MNKAQYDKLGIVAFGDQLLNTGDLDPVYLLLHDAKMPSHQLSRWLVSYWCFYDAGVASWISEHQDHYWHWMDVAALNLEPSPIGGRWPRGTERRHFRGKAAVDCMEIMRLAIGDPEMFIGYLREHAHSFESLSKRITALPMFGKWIAFKVADMLERVCEIPVNFDEAAVFMFDQPVDAAVMLYRLRHGGDALGELEAIRDSVSFLQDHFGKCPAPPRYERSVNLQEIETILCKWKSHMSGSYPLNKDIDELSCKLMPWANVSAVANKMWTYVNALRGAR